MNWKQKITKQYYSGLTISTLERYLRQYKNLPNPTTKDKESLRQFFDYVRKTYS